MINNYEETDGRNWKYELAKVELIGSLWPISKYFIECDRDDEMLEDSDLKEFERITRRAYLNSYWQ